MERFPEFWDWLADTARLGEIISLDVVDAEIIEGDALARWKQEFLPRGFFRRATDESSAALVEFLTWFHQNEDYTPKAKSAFLRKPADSRLLAYAKAHGLTIVTYEKSQTNKPSIIRIPDLARGFGVETITVPELMVQLNAPFVDDLLGD